MNKFVQISVVLSLFWFIYPQEAWCGGCKSCDKRAIDLRKKLLEQQQENVEPQGYDVSMTDWKISSSDDDQNKGEEKKKKKKKKKEEKDKDKDKKSNTSFLDR